MVKFGTIESTQELKKLMEADKDLPKLLKGLNTTRTSKVTDRPDLKQVFERIEDGKVVEIRYLEPSDKPEFIYEASWDVWKGIVENKIDAQKALVQGKMKIEGDMQKMTKYLKGMLKIQDLQKKVTYEW
jgi:putative sterol carrier protein